MIPTKKQHTQLSSLTQALQQACTAVDVSIVRVIMKIKSCFFRFIFSARKYVLFFFCLCKSIFDEFIFDWHPVCMLTFYVYNVVYY